MAKVPLIFGALFLLPLCSAFNTAGGLLRFGAARSASTSSSTPLNRLRPAVGLRDIRCSTSSAPPLEAIRLAKLLKNRPLFDAGVVGGKTCADAFEEKRHLTDQDLDALRVAALHDDYDDDGAPFSARRAVVKLLREKEDAIVASAKAEVLRQFPGITEPGGGLYPPTRSDACWRDFCTFLQCVSYGAAADVPGFTNPTGADLMRDLYVELKVPLDAMVVGVKSLKGAAHDALAAAAAAADAESSAQLRRGWPAAEAAFDHLVDVLRRF